MRVFVLALILMIVPLQAMSLEVRPGIMRTPDTMFEYLKDFDFEPNYMNIQGLRIHYLDEGPEDGKPIFLIHGDTVRSSMKMLF